MIKSGALRAFTLPGSDRIRIAPEEYLALERGQLAVKPGRSKRREKTDPRVLKLLA
jgi:hypothetical protein